jgi:hypothetical protein
MTSSFSSNNISSISQSSPHSFPTLNSPTLDPTLHTTLPSFPSTPLPSSPQPSLSKRSRPLPSYSQGELGKFAVSQALQLEQLGWQQFFYIQQRPSALTSTIRLIPHPAAEYLARLASLGVPLLTSDLPWTMSQRDAIHSRGPIILP